MRKYMFLAVVCCSCGLFKQTSTETENNHQLSSNRTDYQLTERKDWLSRSGSITFSKDTNHTDYSIQIWPKGKFSYSQENGFTGEADRVMIRGKISGSSVFSGSSIEEQQDKGKVAVKLSQKDKQVTDDKRKVKTSSYSWQWILAGLGLIVIAGWIVYEKYFKN